MKLEMSLKKNVVGDLKFWKYFRTRFAGTHPPRLLVSPVAHWLQRQKILVILMGHQKMPKIWDVFTVKMDTGKGQKRNVEAPSVKGAFVRVAIGIPC